MAFFPGPSSTHIETSIVYAKMSGHPAVKGLADPSLLKKIDKFFELGIGEYVALAQVRYPFSAENHLVLTGMQLLIVG